MTKLKPYAKYKDSGIEWLGEIPEDWDITSIRSLFRNKSDKGYPDEKLLSVYREYGVIEKDSRDDNHNVTGQDLSNYKLVKVSDLVVNKMKTWQGSLGISKYHGIVSPAYITASLISDEIDPDYVNYLLRIKNYVFEYNRLSYGVRVGQWDMHYEDFKKIPVVLPPKSTQTFIVKYLDIKIKDIDTYIKKLKKEMELLKEHRQNIISQAVTCGLDEKGRLRSKPIWEEGFPIPDGWKDSGLKWLGLIPEGWEILKGKALFRLQKRDLEQGYKTVTVFRDGVVTLRENRRTSGFTNSLLEIGYQGVNNGDLVIHQMDAFAGAIGVCDSNGKCSPVCLVLSPTRNISPYYFALLLRHVAKTGWIKALSRGIRQRSTDFRYEMFANQYYCVPSFESQLKIVEFIESKIIDIDSQLKNILKQMDFIKEYKQSLISKVVTGKVDVRDIK